MHIKCGWPDGVLCITGGRNLSDRYFNAAKRDNFDMDVVSAGHVVADMQKVLMRIGTETGHGRGMISMRNI